MIDIYYLNDIVEKAVKEYNDFRSPEATASIIKINEKYLIISFKGHFCFTCGFHDWFEDFRLILEDYGLKTEISGIEQMELDKFNVKFIIHNKI
ncbi:MAG: hypothetical protein N3E39_00100 [Candidatus Methanomethylicia archaeon]|nr:hypothetical protein [Candidatus Methanomethylicia archaeon]